VDSTHKLSNLVVSSDLIQRRAKILQANSHLLKSVKAKAMDISAECMKIRDIAMTAEDRLLYGNRFLPGYKKIKILGRYSSLRFRYN